MQSSILYKARSLNSYRESIEQPEQRIQAVAAEIEETRNRRDELNSICQQSGISIEKNRLAREEERLNDEQRAIARTLSETALAIKREANKLYHFSQRAMAWEEEALAQVVEVAKSVERSSQPLAAIQEEYSDLNIFWLNEQQAQIQQLENRLKELDTEQGQLNTRKGVEKGRCESLEEEIPRLQRELQAKEAKLDSNPLFTVQYREAVGIPSYTQALNGARKPNMELLQQELEKSNREHERAKKQLFYKRREFAEQFRPCSFRVESMDNSEYEQEQQVLEQSKLPEYREKMRLARESAMEQFQNDFLARLKSSIDQVQGEVKKLNQALKRAQFGTDSYAFKVERNPDYASYYDMIMAPELMQGDVGLFALPFQQKYGALIEELFSQIVVADDTQLNATKQSEVDKNILRYTDFRTYLKFDLEITDQNGSKQLLSKTLNTKSGGETQTPFYIAVLASFVQIYKVNHPTDNNTVRLVVFDEAFNKMDGERIAESIKLLRKMGLQAIVCAPPEKVADIMPLADRTLLVHKQDYRMRVLPYSKELVE